MAARCATNYIRRSQLYRWHESQNGVLCDYIGSPVVEYYAGVADEDAAARTLAICDLSTLPRYGLAGSGAYARLQSGRDAVPEAPNKSQRQANGDLLVRLSSDEFLVLRMQFNGATSELSITPRPDTQSQNYFEIPRQDSHCWFALSGDRVAETLAKVCGVDLRPRHFALYDVAQTSVARISAIIVRHDLGSVPCYSVLASSSAAEYLWDCLFDAMQEHDGIAIGLAALKSLESS